MAYIGGIYVFVESEDLDAPVEISEHPVESGSDITAHVQPRLGRLSIRGEIVGKGHMDTVARFRQMQREGMVFHYVGRNVFPNAHIAGFTTRASYKIADGIEFEMELRQMRVARTIFQGGVRVAGDVVIAVVGFDGGVRLENLSQPKKRYHVMMGGESLHYVARQYRSYGVTPDSLRDLNRGREIFRPGCTGDFGTLLPGARLFLGVW